MIDKRLKIVTEVINNIRAVKLYSYERHFGEQVSRVRQEELKNLKGYGKTRAAIYSVAAFTPILAAVCRCGSVGELLNR
jgi:ATP-binding cassette subfamily C (CFTR/MRP) protein 1